MSGISMAKIEDYKIVSYNNHNRLNSEVTNLIAKGYQPWGELNVTTIPNSITPVFTQSMVKYNALWPDS